MLKHALLICSLCPAFAIHAHQIEELIVEASPLAKNLLLETEGTHLPSADSGTLLKSIAGADINSNGPLTSIAQYRGASGDRINVSIDGACFHQWRPQQDGFATVVYSRHSARHTGSQPRHCLGQSSARKHRRPHQRQ